MMAQPGADCQLSKIFVVNRKLLTIKLFYFLTLSGNDLANCIHS